MKVIAAIGGCGNQESDAIVLSGLIINQWLENMANYYRNYYVLIVNKEEIASREAWQWYPEI